MPHHYITRLSSFSLYVYVYLCVIRICVCVYKCAYSTSVHNVTITCVPSSLAFPLWHVYIFTVCMLGNAVCSQRWVNTNAPHTFASHVQYVQISVWCISYTYNTNIYVRIWCVTWMRCVFQYRIYTSIQRRRWKRRCRARCVVCDTNCARTSSPLAGWLAVVRPKSTLPSIILLQTHTHSCIHMVYTYILVWGLWCGVAVRAPSRL